VTEREADRSSR